MPQGISAVRPTNGLYLYLYVSLMYELKKIRKVLVMNDRLNKFCTFYILY